MDPKTNGTPVTAIYALTGIYFWRYILRVDSSFAIVAEPNRRAILGLLLTSEHSVGELEQALGKLVCKAGVAR